MDNTLKLRVMFDMVDSWTKPLKNILGGNKQLAQSLKQTRDELADLDKQQKSIAAFQEMRTGLRATSENLTATQANVETLAKSLRTFGQPSQQMIADLDQARDAARKLRATQTEQKRSLSEMRSQLRESGIDTSQLADHQRTLRTIIAATNAQLEAQNRQFDERAAAERRLDIARKKMRAGRDAAVGLATRGHTARTAGLRVLGDIGQTLDETKSMESEIARMQILGLGDQTTKEAVKYVSAMKAMGVSATENMALMRESLTRLSDEHQARMAMPTLAKMKFANAALFSAEDAHANEDKFMDMLEVIKLRGGMRDAATFEGEANAAQKMLWTTGGRVGSDEWRHFVQTGGAAAKQLRNDAFYSQMEPLIRQMGGEAAGTGLRSAYNDIYQGKTTANAARQMIQLGLIDKNGIAHNALGQGHFKAGALKGGEVLKQSPLEWMEKYFLPALKAKGIANDGQIKDMISAVFADQSAAKFMSALYTRRVQIHENGRSSANAYGIDKAGAIAANTTRGKEGDLRAMLHDLRQQVGQPAMPLYNDALDKTRIAVKDLMRVMKEHPEATKAIVRIVVVFGTLLVALGSLTVSLAGLLGPLAMVRFSLTAIGVKAGMLRAVFRSLGDGLRVAGRAFMMLGRFALANPIILVVTLLAMAAFYVWRNWSTLRPKFALLWNALLNGLHVAGNWIREKWAAIITWIKQKLEAIKAWFLNAGASFVEIGKSLLGGLVTGITDGLGNVKNAITHVADSTVTWFKERLGIHSPSIVFARLGGFVSEGAAIGMSAGQRHVSAAAAGLAAVAITSFGAPALSSAAERVAANTPLMSSASPVYQRSTPATDRARHAPDRSVAPAVINIYGNDPHAIAREVNAVLERRERDRRLRAGSRLSD